MSAPTTRTSVNVVQLQLDWIEAHPRPEWERPEYWKECRPCFTETKTDGG